MYNLHVKSKYKVRRIDTVSRSMLNLLLNRNMKNTNSKSKCIKSEHYVEIWKIRTLSRNMKNIYSKWKDVKSAH